MYQAEQRVKGSSFPGCDRGPRLRQELLREREKEVAHNDDLCKSMIRVTTVLLCPEYILLPRTIHYM